MGSMTHPDGATIRIVQADQPGRAVGGGAGEPDPGLRDHSGELG